MEGVNSKQELGKEAGEFYPRWRTMLHFLVGLVFMVVFWPLGVGFVLLTKGWSKVRGDAAVKHRAAGQRALSRAFRVCLKGLSVLGIVRIEDKELAKRVPLEGPLVIVGNHPALWDSLLIMRHCEAVSCIMKASLLSNPLLRGGALFAGFLPNAPKLEMIRRAVERLKSGGQLLLFPEGTRTKGENGVLNPFFQGMALIVKQAGVPVLPVFIETNSGYLGKGWPIWKMPNFPVRISVKVGEVLAIERGEKTRDFSDRVEGVFREQLEEGERG